MFEREIAEAARDYVPDDRPEFERELYLCRICGKEPGMLRRDGITTYQCNNAECDSVIIAKSFNSAFAVKLWNRLNR